MATIMTKKGSHDNIVAYEHVCDTIADMRAIDPKYITLGSVCTVLYGASGSLEVYMANSLKQWLLLSGAGNSDGGSEEGGGSNNHASTVSSLDNTAFAQGNIIEIVGIPEYVDNINKYANYGITETGWYAFARIENLYGVSAETQVTGANYIAHTGDTYVDLAIQFDVAATSRVVTIKWNSQVTESFVFKATDLAIRNLDYRTTFYVYDLDEFVTWEYALTSDTTFAANKNYYTLSDGSYNLAEVAAGEVIPENTYYNHSKIIIQGAARNVTYKLDTIIDCPMEFILPEIEDETHGCWFEMRFRHAGAYSMTLTPPAGVKVATEHTQAEIAGFNTIDLHYNNIDGVKLWRFLNTHSSIPET